MKRQIHKLTALLLAVWLLAGAAMPAAWAASSDEITISSVEDLLDFAKNCALDTWSQGKNVILTADLDLTGQVFAPIPTFGGTFRGEGHTISGIHITASGSNMGFFRYLQKGAVVQDLHITGTVAPDGSRSTVGGIAGVNAGTIRNCSFTGTVKGDSTVGGIAGRNTQSGEIAGCTAAGAIQGENGTGGIAGRNLGVLLKCQNTAGVNLSEQESTVDLEALASGDALERLTDSGEEDDLSILNSHTDTGGVAGYSSGVIQSCINSGTVGYPHVGYNVGGVAGRQTGYLAGCANSGTVYGRKDVGGIVGQAEPYLALDPGTDTLEKLRTELDTLNALVDRAISHAENGSDDISVRLTGIGTSADAARDSSKVLLEHAADFVDDNVEAVNSLSASITDALDDMDPALEDFSSLSRQLQKLASRLEDAFDALENPDAKDASGELGDAGTSMEESIREMREAREALLKAIIEENPAGTKLALQMLSKAMGAFGESLRITGQAVAHLREALDGRADELVLDALEELAGHFTEAGDAVKETAATIPDWTLEDWESLREHLKETLEKLTIVDDAVKKLRESLHRLRDILAGIQTAAGELKEASRLAANMGDTLEDAFDTLRDAISDLTEDGPVEFVTLGDEVRDAGDDLYGSLSDISGELEELKNAVKQTGDDLAADLRAISSQLNKVFDLVLDALTDIRGGEDGRELSDLIEDTSDQDIAATRQGKITDCRNTGAVEGDRNVGGIVGAMAIEYDLDPEDDIDRFSLGSSYETKAVLQNSVNRGAVTAKKDCAGGLAGRMDLGTVLNCQNYGDVTSTGGDYVGGIAGRADATVRENYAKCVLSGACYVGGIAGWGDRLRDNCAIITVAEGTECVGAIAGDADLEDGELRGNRFVDTGTAGIDGISYAGLAEPVAFEELRQMSGVPAEFVSFTLTLVADGETVARIPFRYGEDLSLIDLPEVPEKQGHYGLWPEFDSSGLNSDITLEAEYEPLVTLLASEETDGKLALALAEGSFTGDAVLHAEPSGETPPEAAGEDQRTDVWEITLTGTGLTESDTVPLRLLNRGGGSAEVWQLADGTWKKVDFTVNGQYLILNMTGTGGIFCIQSARRGLMLPLMLLAAVLLFLVICLLVRQLRKKKQKKSPRAGEKQKTDAASPSGT
nr:GLUG motif-containing protein [uncultured Oscillibacter sp.]